VLNGVDAVVFTAGIGENNAYIRREVLKDMDFFGIKIDLDKNEVKGKEADISAPDAKVKTLVIPTNEELEIARETLRLVKTYKRCVIILQACFFRKRLVKFFYFLPGFFLY